MNKLKAFVYGVIEFRYTVTSHYADYALQDAYEWGREWAHRLTFRYYEV